MRRMYEIRYEDKKRVKLLLNNAKCFKKRDGNLIVIRVGPLEDFLIFSLYLIIPNLSIR